MNLTEDLFSSCRSGDCEQVKKLLENGADISAREIVGCRNRTTHSLMLGRLDPTPFCLWSRSSRRCSCTCELWGCYLNQELCECHLVDSLLNYLQSGTTPLHYACSHGEIKVVDLLLESGAHLEACDNVSCQLLVMTI
jgi:ankyrin repeat protein